MPGRVSVGAEVLANSGFAPLRGKRVGLVVNRASVVNGQHLIDLIGATPDVRLTAIFAPEHGVRADADAGDAVSDSTDPRSGAPIFSLYGDTKTPTASMLANVDVLVFDLQDTGTRYYTYIATLGRVMQAAGEHSIPLIVCDRPNPLGGDGVGGYQRDPDKESFISPYPVPSVYGLTIGELATAIHGEGWGDGTARADVSVIWMQGWSRAMRVTDTGLTWTPPSPGLQTTNAAMLYPAMVAFEPTVFSYGSGTTDPFTAIASPWADSDSLAAAVTAAAIPGLSVEPTSFTPSALPGMAQTPQYMGQTVHGVRLTVTDAHAFDPSLAAVALLVVADRFADDHGHPLIRDRATFDLLAGTSRLRERLAAGDDAATIVESQRASRADWAAVRAQYVHYP